jgi:large subunit ribosomal protein L10
MDNPRAEKVAVVAEVRQRFEEASAAILTEYRGLKVKDLAGLRRSLRSSGGDYKVYKNTLVRLAARDSGLVDLDPMLVGPTAIAFVDGDAASVAKALRDYSRTNPLLVIKGGVLGDKVIDARETAALADLPSRDVLLARFAGALAAPMQQLAGLLQALPRNLAYGLAALRDKRAEGEPAGETAAPPESPAPATPPEPAAVEAGASTPSQATPTDSTPSDVAESDSVSSDSPPSIAPPPDAAAAGSGPADADLPDDDSPDAPAADAGPPDAPAADAGPPDATAANPDPPEATAANPEPADSTSSDATSSDSTP